ncbi:hypothetical protein [Micromonospora sp. NPDC049204]|uniref:hypothetical protein n=1 Tax=Micromonospora sp. NPDC049204 TaxID=3154351 RepID=UPI0033C5D33F
MFTVLSAAVVTAWLAIALLALGYGGLVVQIRELQSRGTHPSRTLYPELAAPERSLSTVALAVTKTCPTCAEAFEEWRGVARDLKGMGHRPVTISLDGSTDWLVPEGTELKTADELTSPFLLAYQPALLIIDSNGELLSAEPVGSAVALRKRCYEVMNSNTVVSS